MVYPEATSRSPAGEMKISDIGSSVLATTCQLDVSHRRDPAGIVLTDQLSSSSMSSTSRLAT